MLHLKELRKLRSQRSWKRQRKSTIKKDLEKVSEESSWRTMPSSVFFIQRERRCFIMTMMEDSFLETAAQESETLELYLTGGR